MLTSLNVSQNSQDSSLFSSIIKRWKQWSVITVVALFIEIFVWNNYYWSFDAETYPTQEVSLPYQSSLQRNAMVVFQEQPSLTLSGLNTLIHSVEIECYGGSYMVKGDLMATSQNYAYKPQRISPFMLASGLNQDLTTPAQDYQRSYVKFDLPEPVLSLIFMLDAKTIPSPLVITKIVINPKPDMDFSTVRLALTWLALVLVYALCSTQLYQHKLVVGSKSYNLVNHAILLIVVLYSCGIFVAHHPNFVTNSVFRPIALGLYPYNTPNRTVLQEIPKTQEDLGNVDIYIQLTDALLVKKHLNLDLWVDPKLMQLDNVYDRSEREVKQTKYYWDHAFYEGKYYCYYGLAPWITIYAPIFLLTGLVPSPALSVFIAALYALLGIHLLSSRMTKLLCDECNTLLFVVSKLTLFIASLAFLIQSQFNFYNLPSLLACAAVCLALYFGFGLLLRPKHKTQETKDTSIAPNVESIEHIDANKDSIAHAEDIVSGPTKHDANSTHGHVADNVREDTLAPISTIETKSLTAHGLEQSKKEEQRKNADTNTNSSEHDAIISKQSLKRQLQGIVTNLKEIFTSKTTEVLPYSRDTKQMLAMLCCGCCVVLTVMSRPMLLLYLIVGVGICYLLYVFKGQVSIKSKIVNSACLFIPVLAGAVLVSWYNYARFESIFEFGQYKQLTVDDVNNNPIHLNLPYIKTALFNILFANFEFSSNFPYVGHNEHAEAYLGQFQFYSLRSGLMMIPYYWGLMLLPVLWKIKSLSGNGMYQGIPGLESGLSLLSIKVTWSLFYVLFGVILWFTVYNAGWNYRYLSDVTVVAAILPFMLMLLVEFKWQSSAERILFVGWIGLCVVSCILMFFLAINNGSADLELLNPSLYLELKTIFDPLGFN